MGYYGVSINTQISTAYSQSNIEARSLVDDGQLHALVGDFSQLPTYLGGNEPRSSQPSCLHGFASLEKLSRLHFLLQLSVVYTSIFC